METTLDDKQTKRTEIAGADRLLTVNEVAGLLNVKTGYIYDRIMAGRLPWGGMVKIGRHLRFRFSEIQKFIEQGGKK